MGKGEGGKNSGYKEKASGRGELFCILSPMRKVLIYIFLRGNGRSQQNVQVHTILSKEMKFKGRSLDLEVLLYSILCFHSPCSKATVRG